MNLNLDSQTKSGPNSQTNTEGSVTLVDKEGVTLENLAIQVSQIASKLSEISKFEERSIIENPTALVSYPPQKKQCDIVELKDCKDTTALDPQLLRKIIKVRQKRALFFNHDLFSEPAWDMLLDLAAAREEGSRVSVTSLCIASGVPATTALRWIKHMIDTGIFKRVTDPTDKRRAFVELTDKGVEAMNRYFETVYFEEMSPR